MPADKDYSFTLQPGRTIRKIAGPYDTKLQKPHYEIDVNVPQHVANLVVVNEILIGNEKFCQLAWDINNGSTWPAFVTIKKDGVIIK